MIILRFDLFVNFLRDLFYLLLSLVYNVLYALNNTMFLFN